MISKNFKISVIDKDKVYIIEIMLKEVPARSNSLSLRAFAKIKHSYEITRE